MTEIYPTWPHVTINSPPISTACPEKNGYARGIYARYVLPENGLICQLASSPANARAKQLLRQASPFFRSDYIDQRDPEADCGFGADHVKDPFTGCF